ncbi:MAG: hypothetical protein KJ906_03170 [Nanoarchaeota archaeon]|nr:hypothetical protein [Nanoarchaeota archaeon]
MADYIEISGKKHQISDRNDFYKDGKFTGRFCPRCGPGIKLAAHKDRVTCGKCGYSEKQVKKEEPSKQEVPIEVKKEEPKE